MNQFPYLTTKRSSGYDQSSSPMNTRMKAKSRVQQNSSIMNSDYMQQYVVSKELPSTKMLYLESENQFLSVFKIYFDLLGVTSEIINCNDRYKRKYIQIKRGGKNYAAVVLDIGWKEGSAN